MDYPVGVFQTKISLHRFVLSTFWKHLFLVLVCLSSASIFRSVSIPSLMLTWFQKDPNVSHPTSQETRHPWENCFLAFLSTMPYISGISSGFENPPTVPGPDYFSLPFLILCRFSGQTLSLSCVASSTLVSCFWLKDRSRWELWP